MLDAKELAQLKKLQEKAKKSEADLTEEELAAFEGRATKAGDSYDRSMQELFVQPWIKHCEQVRDLANDNARLVAEVRKLVAERDASAVALSKVGVVSGDDAVRLSEEMARNSKRRV